MTAYDVLVQSLGDMQVLLKDHECLLNSIMKGDDLPALKRCVSTCPHKERLRETLLATIQELEESRKSFKSRRLEILRRKLIEVLAETA